MNMNDVFAKIDAWEFADMQAAAAISDASAASANRAHAIAHKWADMRNDVMKVAFNAEQFNRRSAWMRNHPDRTKADAAAMFPVSQ